MSLFTEAVNVGQPHCPRCRSPQFVILVRREGGFAIWDCKKCGPVVPPKKRPTG